MESNWSSGYARAMLDALMARLMLETFGNVRCVVCNGDDASVPCAYPSEGKNGCVRDARLSREGTST